MKNRIRELRKQRKISQGDLARALHLSQSAVTHYENGRRKLVRINKDMVMDEHAQWIIKPPKSDAANRSVPVPDWLLQIVQKKPSSYTFMRPTSITDAFGKLAQKHGLSCSFHGLRHYYASVMESLGIPESYQMERLGHTTNSMLKRYQEYLREKEAEVNDALMDHLNALNPKKKAATTE